jgi:uncharacterized protein (TIGR03083 family)
MMKPMDTWEMIRAERAALAGDLAALPADAWDKPSLLPGWTVRDVVAHMIATARMTPPKFFAGMAGSGFRFNAFSDKNIARVKSGRTDADLVAEFRAAVDARTAPPGPSVSWLGETVVHGNDVSRALGGYRAHPAEHVTAVAEFYSGSNLLIGAKNRIEGVTLAATDADWRHGTGPEVTGPAIALVMAMTGRPVALDDLSGPGVEVLRSRT